MRAACWRAAARRSSRGLAETSRLGCGGTIATEGREEQRARHARQILSQQCAHRARIELRVIRQRGQHDFRSERLQLRRRFTQARLEARLVQLCPAVRD